MAIKLPTKLTNKLESASILVSRLDVKLRINPEIVVPTFAPSTIQKELNKDNICKEPSC